MLLLVLLLVFLQEGLHHPRCKATTSSHPMDKCVCSGKRPPPCRLQSHAKLSPDAVATVTANEQYRCGSFSAPPAACTLPSHHKLSADGQMCLVWEEACTMHPAKPRQALTRWTNVAAVGRGLQHADCQGTTSSHSMDLAAVGRGLHHAHCQATTSFPPMDKCGCSGERPAPCTLPSHHKLSSDGQMWLLWEEACTMQAAEPCQALTR